MPNYKYHCTNGCGHDFEITCKISEYVSEPKCPKCGENAQRKVDDLVCRDIWKCDGAYGKTSN